MGKLGIGKFYTKQRSVLLLLWFLLPFVLLCLYFLSWLTFLANYQIPTVNPNPYSFEINIPTKSNPLITNSTTAVSNLSRSDACSSRYIYVHKLPSKFNDDIIKNCALLFKWSDMCPDVVNSGSGPPIKNPGNVLSNNSWYATNQFLLEVIFRERMKSYECLTDDSSTASAIYVPYYAGLDVGRYLWGYNTSIRDSLAYDLVDWLGKKPEWKKMWGRDHFLIGGRTSWDFRRYSDNEADWGNKLMFFPESMNITMLTIETTSWSNEFGIPYPTYFHPSSDKEIFQWQNKVASRERKYLFAFVGAKRPNMKNSLRNEIINQCLESKSKKCHFLDCNSIPKICENPVEVIKLFESSIFCLQPPGDSPTRRSTFDSILAGCIPVFFHPGSAYAQYLWHFPRNYTKYSVFIPMNEVKDAKLSIEETLLGISEDRVKEMKEEIIKLIPKIVYARRKLEENEDAVDIAVKGVIERVHKVRQKMKEGVDVIGFAQDNSWKLKLNGTGKEDEWLHFF
ncbi:hypothetical protein ACFE04_004960 [Oxalis oulophora]